MSSRQRLAGSPLRLVSGRDPVSARFGDQLIAVLPRLRRFARGLSGSVADADDLVQAACERALARQHQFQEGTRFDSWMFRIVQTIWIDQIRSRDVRKEDGDIAEDRLGSDEPVRRVEARLALAEVRRALDRLPPDQRAALLLVTVEGLSYKEAAEVVHVPVGTIMSRLSRARIALQLQLEAGRGGAGVRAMQQRSDDRLIAYLDGELEVAQRREVEAWLDADPAARRRMAALAESANLLRLAFDEAIREPVPDRLVAAARGETARTASGRPRFSRSVAGWARRSWPREFGGSGCRSPPPCSVSSSAAGLPISEPVGSR